MFFFFLNDIYSRQWSSVILITKNTIIGFYFYRNNSRAVISALKFYLVIIVKSLKSSATQLKFILEVVMAYDTRSMWRNIEIKFLANIIEFRGQTHADAPSSQHTRDEFSWIVWMNFYEIIFTYLPIPINFVHIGFHDILLKCTRLTYFTKPKKECHCFVDKDR